MIFVLQLSPQTPRHLQRRFYPVHSGLLPSNLYRLNSTNIRDPVNPVNRSLPIPNFLSLSMDYRIPTFQSNPKMNEMTRIQNYTLSDSRLHQTQDKPEGDDASLFRSLSTARGGGGGGDVNSSGDHAEHLTQRFDGLKESGYIMI
ncbi:hypothetical protein ABKN59_011003 [Abortiporus biennis]